VLSSLELATTPGEAGTVFEEFFHRRCSMSNGSADETDASASENSERNANSPANELRPNSPTSQRPAVPGSQPPPKPITPLEAPLTPVVGYKSFSPKAPYSSALTPKPSAAPAPRLRPGAPAGAPPVAGTGGSHLSAADEIAGMLSPGRAQEAADAQAGFDASMLEPSAPQSQSAPKPTSRFHDPLFFRRTIIPILLTLGAILFGWAVLLLTTDQNNALADLFPAWTPFAMLGAGLVFFALAFFNILSIKNAK
jgi:hypothetical protein